jgi:hypothetical protein
MHLHPPSILAPIVGPLRSVAVHLTELLGRGSFAINAVRVGVTLGLLSILLDQLMDQMASQIHSKDERNASIT